MDFDNYSWNPIIHDRRLNEPDSDVEPLDMTMEQAQALLALTGNDLGACIDFANAQAEEQARERAHQNVPPDEGGL